MKSMTLMAGLALGLLLGGAAQAELQPVGAVDKVQEDVVARRGEASTRLQIEDAVMFRDELVSGPKARLSATLTDGTQLTLGEKARLSIDEFVYNPDGKGNRLAINVARGAFLFVGGKIEGPTGGNVTINTPVGTLGVRGTTVWGGPIDRGYGVVVLDGLVTVTTSGGRVTLNKGEGTMVYNAAIRPEAPAPWSEDRMTRAVETISFEAN